jgi:hypothetical protein
MQLRRKGTHLNIKRKTISLVAAASVAVTTLAGAIILAGPASASSFSYLTVCNDSGFTIDGWAAGQGELIQVPSQMCGYVSTSGGA